MLLEVLIATAGLTPDLDRRVLDSEQVVLGRVERVFDFPAGELRHQRLAQVRVEHRFTGPADEKVLYALSESSAQAPGVGERGLYFLEPWSGNGGRGMIRLRTDDELREVRAWSPRSEWSATERAGGVRLPQELETERARAGKSLEADSLIADLEASVSRCLPVVRAEIVVLGPGWSVEIGPDRRTVEGGRPTGTLSAKSWESLLQAFERNDFPELPERVGRSLGPDESVLVIGFRSRTGLRTVRIESHEPDTPEAAAAWQRARQIWDAIEAAVRAKD